MQPWRTGLAFAITVMAFYMLCTVAWVLAPAAFLGFMQALFHDLDFSSLVRTSSFHWTSAVVPALVLGLWALGAGTFFAWLHKRLAR
jgi:hypothetical protein